MAEPTLIDRLAAHRTIGGVPRPELEWLVARGRVRQLAPGDMLTSAAADQVVAGMYIILSGRVAIHLDRGAGPRKVMEWQGGDLTGMLPYSRLRVPPAAVIAEEPTTILMIDRADVPAMPTACPELTAVAVHVMLDRARMFTSSELLDEKLVSLGRLAAGIAHELNNPASAMVRNAAAMQTALEALHRAVIKCSAVALDEAAYATIHAIQAEASAGADTRRTPLEAADREDELTAWLESRGLTDTHAHPLSEAGVTPVHLERLDGAIGRERLQAAIERLAADHAVRQLATDMSTASVRIHELVAALKRFTYMDQAMVPTPMHLVQGLADTLTMLRSKARTKGVELTLDIDDGLPRVNAFGGELNQVWTNLVDNAIDATPRGGRVHVSACRAGTGSVVIKVKDTGAGIPKEIQPRIFDPFFTTKAIGEGTGLGLDIARRLIVRHRGEIELKSSPAGTEFSVTLPAVADDVDDHRSGVTSPSGT